MQNSLSPAFVRIDYTSIYGAHSMTLPSVDVGTTTIGGDIYQFLLPIPLLPTTVSGAVEDFVDVIKPFFIPSTIFNGYTLFTQATPEDTPVPVETNNLNIAGTGGDTTWEKAVQFTLTWRTTEFGVFKLVFLDAVSNNNFDKITDADSDIGLDPVNEYVTASVSWLRGRDGGRPKTFLQAAKTLNEKLRRSYRMN
jgi:hypothetical protein